MSEPKAQEANQTEKPAAEPIQQYIGLDLHKQDSQLCNLDLEGKVTKEVRIRTSRSSLIAELEPEPRSRIPVEASTESEWVARVLEELGHEVIVADPNFAPMYATRSRKIKTDKRDARALAEACRLGAFRRAHRCAESQRHIKAVLCPASTAQGEMGPSIGEARSPRWETAGSGCCWCRRRTTC